MSLCSFAFLRDLNINIFFSQLNREQLIVSGSSVNQDSVFGVLDPRTAQWVILIKFSKLIC